MVLVDPHFSDLEFGAEAVRPAGQSAGKKEKVEVIERLGW